jgi:hypothetical protein
VTVADGVARVRAAAAGLRAWVESGAAQSKSGAFMAWRDLDGSAGSYEYPEITGYVLTYLASCSPFPPALQQVGNRAGAWLAGRLARGELCARDGWDDGAIYLFDLGMIATGLISFGRRTGAESLVACGVDLVTLLRAALEGDLSPVWSDGPRSGRRAWSTHGNAHLAKLVQALLLVDRGPSGTAASLVERVERLQRDDGAFETGPEPEVMLHPHLYAAEGMWIWGTATGDDDALTRTHAALAWTWRHQLPTGGLPRAASSRLPIEQSDATAQALRLAIALGLRSAAVDRAAARLAELASPDGEGRAIVYEPGWPRHANTWATLFAAQALASTLPEARPLEWWELV